MKTDRSVPKTIDEYIAGFPAEVRAALESIRATIRSAAPRATEAIKYGMPTFVLNGNLVHFAAWKKHIGFYHPSTAYETLQDQLAAYAGPKGSLKFPLDQPLPLGLIRKVVKIRIKENLEKAAAQGKRKSAK